MKVVTAKEMQYIDSATINTFGIPGSVLMAHAGRAVFDVITSQYKILRRVLVISGTGNNGGDGFVISYHLKNSDIDVRHILIGSPKKLSPESTIFYELCNHSGITIEEADTSLIRSIDYAGYDLIVDAMTGTGFSGSARGLLHETINAINNYNKNMSPVPVVSVDMPSGLPADGGAPEGEVIKADMTVTIGLPKISLVTFPGKSFTGILRVVDIGFPADLVRSSELKSELITADLVKRNIGFPRNADTYKNAEGHLLLIGGFAGMEGAILLSAMAALESGAGLVTIATHNKARDIIAGKIPEVMTVSIDENNVDESIKNIFNDKIYDSVVMGPGMGRTLFSEKVILSVLDNIDIYTITKLLIDGDGLYHSIPFFQKNTKSMTNRIIVTPHFKEASRLTGVPVDQIKQNRYNESRKCASLCKAVTVLKGPATIVTDGDMSYINTTGNPAMAAAGSGDVLSGIIGALMLKNSYMINAAAAGVFIHGQAADQYCLSKKSFIIKSRNIVQYINTAIKIIIDE